MSEGLTVEGLGVCTTLRGGDSETECADLAAAVAEEAPTELGVALLLQMLVPPPVAPAHSASRAASLRGSTVALLPRLVRSAAPSPL